MFGKLDNSGQVSVGAIAGILIGLAIAIYVTSVLMTSLNLNSGLYNTVLTIMLPILVFVAVAGFILAFLR
jgi:hypothetical protein